MHICVGGASGKVTIENGESWTSIGVLSPGLGFTCLYLMAFSERVSGEDE